MNRFIVYLQDRVAVVVPADSVVGRAGKSEFNAFSVWEILHLLNSVALR